MGEINLLQQIEDRPEPSAEPIDSWRLLHCVWDARATIFRWVFLGLVISAIISFLIPKRFEATVKLMPPDDKSSVSNLLTAIGGPGMALAGNILGTKQTGALFVGVLHSRSVQDGIIDRFDLCKVYKQKRRSDARRELEDRTTISEDMKSGIITVTISDRDAYRAKAMADAYTDELGKTLALVSTSAARRERVFLEQRIGTVKQELDQAEKDLSQFSSHSGTIDLPTQGKAMLGAAAELKGRLIAADAQLQGLRQIYTDNNSRVRALEAEAAELKRELQKIGGTSSGNSSPDELEDPSLRQLPILALTYVNLYRKTKIEEAVYETLTKQYELAKVEEAKEIPTVHILDDAVVPDKKSFPPRTAITLVGAFLAGILAAGRVMGRLMWRSMDPNAPAKVFAERVAATSPFSTWRQPIFFVQLQEKLPPWLRVYRHPRTDT